MLVTCFLTYFVSFLIHTFAVPLWYKPESLCSDVLGVIDCTGLEIDAVPIPNSEQKRLNDFILLNLKKNNIISLPDEPLLLASYPNLMFLDLRENTAFDCENLKDLNYSRIHVMVHCVWDHEAEAMGTDLNERFDSLSFTHDQLQQTPCQQWWCHWKDQAKFLFLKLYSKISHTLSNATKGLL